jgi:hypothetical protein
MIKHDEWLSILAILSLSLNFIRLNTLAKAYPGGSPCAKQQVVNRLAYVDPWSACSPEPAVISQVLRGRYSLIYPEDKPGGSLMLPIAIQLLPTADRD